MTESETKNTLYLFFFAGEGGLFPTYLLLTYLVHESSLISVCRLKNEAKAMEKDLISLWSLLVSDWPSGLAKTSANCLFT